MRLLTLLTCITTLTLSLSSCEDDIPGCTNPDATNYDELATTNDGSCILNSNTIIGTWSMSTVEQGYEITEAMVNSYKLLLQSYGLEEFEEEFGPVPSSETEWMTFTVEQSTEIDSLSNSYYQFTASIIDAASISGFTPIPYSFINQNKIKLQSGRDIYGFSEFDISYLTESDLVLSSKKWTSGMQTNKTIEIHLDR